MKKYILVLMTVLLVFCTSCKTNSVNLSDKTEYSKSGNNSEIGNTTEDINNASTNNENQSEYISSGSTGSDFEPETSSPSKVENKSIQALKLGKYKGEIPGADNTYAFITLEPNNMFSLEANIELDHFKYVKPFTRKGTYKYEHSKSDDTYGPSTLVTWLNLYFDDEFYWTYAVVDNETFQDQAIVFSYLD